MVVLEMSWPRKLPGVSGLQRPMNEDIRSRFQQAETVCDKCREKVEMVWAREKNGR